jgi:hypothetical protein
MPVPVPGCLQRIHREHHIPRRHQCHHPRAMTGLDPDPDPGARPHRHRRRRRHARRPAHAAWPCPPRPRSAGPGPEPARPGPSARHRDDQRPSHHQPAELSSAYLPLALDCTGSLRENHQRPNEQCSRQPAGTTSQQRSTLPATGGAQSPNRASTEPGPASAHPPAATRTRACPNTADPLPLIRPVRGLTGALRRARAMRPRRPCSGPPLPPGFRRAE